MGKRFNRTSAVVGTTLLAGYGYAYYEVLTSESLDSEDKFYIASALSALTLMTAGVTIAAIIPPRHESQDTND
jgi:hypothetical protein